MKIGAAVYRPELTDKGGWVVQRSADGEKKYRIAHALGGKMSTTSSLFWTGAGSRLCPSATTCMRRSGSTWPRAACGISSKGTTPRWTGGTAPSPSTPLVIAVTSASSRGISTWLAAPITPFGPSRASVARPATVRARSTSASAGPRAQGPAADRHQDHPHEGDAACATERRLRPLPREDGAVSTSYVPGDRYFDHFDLATLDNPDFYADGRDLGENYTMTSWRMVPVRRRASSIACTATRPAAAIASRRSRTRRAAPCHEDKIAHVAEHAFHKADGPAGRCVACHMPTSGFAAMRRTDHSMRPPMPAATLAFKSPNACDSCHQDAAKNAAVVAAWSDRWVRKWRKRDYQAATLHWAGLIDARTRGNGTACRKSAAS